MFLQSEKNPPAKPQLARHLLSILRMGDARLAIQPYDTTSKANAICHATHIPNDPKEFAIYFPEFTHYLKRYRTKCRITSEIPVWQIKSKVFASLKANDFWMNPSVIKCLTSEKCGFFLYAHHFITQQSDFRRILDPLLKSEWGENEDHEYDFQAETLRVNHQNQRIISKVFMLRSNPKFTSKLQQTLSRIYANTNDTNLDTLSRYKFIPLTSNAVVSDEMLLGLVRSQNAYCDNIFVYVCHNITDIDKQFKVSNPQSDNKEENTDSEEYDYSIRNWFYDIEDDAGSPLIHAAYTMPATTTIKILCERSKRYKVLEILHDLPEIAAEFFPASAIAYYFPTAQAQPFHVEKFPKVSQTCGTYAHELAAYAMSNPQSDDTPVTQDPALSTNAGATKRTRNGDPVQHVTQQAPPVSTPNSVLQLLDANQKRLNAIENENQTRSSTFAQLDKTLTSINSRISTNETAITKITNAQITQGNLIQNINKKQTYLEGNLFKLCAHFGIEVETPPDDTEHTNMDIEQTPDLDAEMDALDKEHQQLTHPNPLTQDNPNSQAQPAAPTGDEGAMES